MTFATREAVVELMLVFVPMLVEARRAARNERAQLARGGIEAPGDVYGIMRAAYPAVFLAMILEGASGSRQPAFADVGQGHAAVHVLVPTVSLLGAAVFIVAKALKWWAILTLGGAWTFRVIVVPGDALRTAGPYAWLRHPNYIAVAGELIGIALVSGARVAGPVGVLAFSALMLRRIAVEERALARARRAR